MKIPLQITWHGVDQSEAIEADIRDKADKLDQFCDNIMSCRVVVEAPHGHHHKGKLYRLSIDIKVPGKEIVVKRNPAEHSAHEDVYVAIRDAFDAARRQLAEFTRERRGDVKAHDVPRHARVIRKFPAQGYGFIETPDRREIYFHRNALLNGDFDKLAEGTEVYFIEEQGEKGPQAKQVTIGKHGVGST